LNSELQSADSALIKKSSQNLLVESMFFKIEEKYYRSEEVDQIFYPSALTPGVETIKSFTYKELNDFHSDQISIRYLSRLINKDDQSIAFEIESTYLELDSLGTSVYEKNSTATTQYVRGQGLTKYISESDGTEITYDLFKVWTLEEWEQRTVASNGY